MEIKVKLNAEVREIEEVFEFDDVLNIRFYERIGRTAFKTIIRIPECDINISSGKIISLEELRQLIVEKCNDAFKIKCNVTFNNGTKRVVYASTNYWKEYNINRLAELYNAKVESIEEIA